MTSRRDAETLCQPYVPGRDGPFGAQQAGHLLRRIGFGGTRAERDRVIELGPARAVADLTRPDDEPGGAHAALLAALQPLAGLEDLDVARSVWLTRMIRSPRPFGERLALCWHGHFATSVAKVGRVGLMVGQLQSLRNAGPGPFGQLLRTMSRDPAMILWLDGNSNRAQHPNENYARELFELFALGEGHYEEADVLEAARAFSGWHTHGGRFRFVAAQHDGGQKHVLAKRGALDGDDVLEACLEQPACARWVVRRLFRFFVHPEPEDALLEVLAARYRVSGYDTLGFVQDLLTSRAFYAPRAWRALVKSPVDLAVGALRALGGSVDTIALGQRLEQLGLGLFAPPSVKGWDGGQAWLSATTIVGRLNLAADLASSGGALGARPADTDTDSNWLLDLLLEDQLPDAARARIDQAPPELALRLVLSLPEYQLA